MGKKNESEVLSIVKAAIQAEWGSSAGKANVLFVVLMVVVTLAEPAIVKIVSILGAYVSTCVTGKIVEPYIEQGISPFLVCTMILMIFCPLLMVFIEICKRRFKSNKPRKKV